VYLNNPAKDDMATVKPGGGNGGDEELGSVGVGAGVGHAQVTRAKVLQLEVLLHTHTQGIIKT